MVKKVKFEIVEKFPNLTIIREEGSNQALGVSITISPDSKIDLAAKAAVILQESESKGNYLKSLDLSRNYYFASDSCFLFSTRFQEENDFFTTVAVVCLTLGASPHIFFDLGPNENLESQERKNTYLNIEKKEFGFEVIGSHSNTKYLDNSKTIIAPIRDLPRLKRILN